MLVFHSDLKAVVPGVKEDYCNRGGRKFFARHGLNWRDFLFNGIDEERLLATNDGMARELVMVARQRRANGQQQQ